MKLTQRSAKPTNDDNLIPLINIVFLMLIFFMVAGHIQAGDLFPVTPPASSSDAGLTPERLEILLAADGRMAVEGQGMEEAQLTQWLAERLSETAVPLQQSVIAIKADSAVTARQLDDTLDILRNAGAQKVTLLTRQGG